MKLEKPIVFFDLETTGVSVGTDKIVQIACVKVNTDLSKEEKKMLINPQIPIPASATEVHGITDEMVKDAPLFKQIAKGLNEFMAGCDLGGYNSDNFDIPLLIEEFKRAGLDFPTWELNFLDVLKYERLLNPQKLEAVYKRYTGKDLDGAHDALNDVRATIEILEFQTAGKELSTKEIDEFCQEDKKRFDYAGKMYVKDEIVLWSFGKNMNKPVLDDLGYVEWVLNQDFPTQTKEKIKQLLKTLK